MGAFIGLLIGFVIMLAVVWGALLRGLIADTWKYDNEHLWGHDVANDKDGPSHP